MNIPRVLLRSKALRQSFHNNNNGSICMNRKHSLLSLRYSLINNTDENVNNNKLVLLPLLLCSNRQKFSSARINNDKEDDGSSSSSSSFTMSSLWNPTEEHAALRTSLRTFVQREVSSILYCKGNLKLSFLFSRIKIIVGVFLALGTVSVLYLFHFFLL